MSTYEEVEKELRKKENRDAVEELHDVLMAFIDAGFSRDEAMDLLKMIIAKRR